MTTRIDRRFAELAREGRAALVTYTMAGDPDTKTSLEILKALPKAGADVIELGMPFTDPMADGPAIQAGGLRALDAGCLGVGQEFIHAIDVDRIEVAHQHDRCCIVGCAEGAHHRQRLFQRVTGLERAMAGGLDRRTVRHRVSERHAKLDHVGAGVRQRFDNRERGVRIRIASHHERHQRRAPRALQVFKSSVDARRHD